MSRTFGTLDASGWVAAEERNVSAVRQYADTDSIYRFINGLDTGVTVAISVTHMEDNEYGTAVQTQTVTVPAGEVGGTVLSEPWERVQFGVTPDVAPTAGTVELLGMGGR